MFVLEVDRQLDGKVAVRRLVKRRGEVAESRGQVVAFSLSLPAKRAVATQQTEVRDQCEYEQWDAESDKCQ